MNNQIYTLIYLYTFGTRHVQTSSDLDTLISEFKNFVNEKPDYVKDDDEIIDFIASVKNLKDSIKLHDEYEDRTYWFIDGDRVVFSCNILI